MGRRFDPDRAHSWTLTEKGDSTTMSPLKVILFEAQNSLFRRQIKKYFEIKNWQKMIFLGNSYSGYWFPEFLLNRKGTIWGIGLGHDSSFEFELINRGYEFYGFEPEINCFVSAKKQFAETASVIENYGLWDKSGKYHYTGQNISIVNIFGLKEQSADMLEIRSLWEVASEKNLTHSRSPRILKLNIEGAEREILLRFLNEPLDFDVLIFQAEFLFHLGFKRIREKISAYKDMKKILNGFQNMEWQIVHFTRHQITILKKEMLE